LTPRITKKYLEVDKNDLNVKSQDARRSICVHDRCDFPMRYSNFKFDIIKKFTNFLLQIFR